MRCRSCDVALTDFESTRKFVETGEFVDLCNSCFKGLGDVAVRERFDLMEAADELTDFDEDS
jgi:hypothetical protein